MMFLRKILLLALVATALLSCNKEMFNESDYKAIVESAQPVSGVDKSHTWDLSTTYYVTLSTANVPAGAKELLILTSNPVIDEGVVVQGRYPLTGDSKEFIAFAAPTIQQVFYAAILDKEGCYTITDFDPSTRTIDFANPLAEKVKIDESTLGTQAYTYCFENEMPEPGDYDYNDVVLRISQERTAANQITLNVTLAAVGALSQVAAAVRLVDYAFDDIERVTTVDDEDFNKGLKKYSPYFIESDELLVKGLGGEAVISLFEDAHWATDAISYASEGYIPRYRYNVAKTTSETDEMVSPRTISYVITFKNAARLNYFTLGMLDPFVIVSYNGAFMEVHSLYKYRLTPILHEYTQPENTTFLPWALVVPSSSFRYPLDGVNMGYSKDGALFGAFMNSGHSFGEWSANHEKATDWYKYPTVNMVY